MSQYKYIHCDYDGVATGLGRDLLLHEGQLGEAELGDGFPAVEAGKVHVYLTVVLSNVEAVHVRVLTADGTVEGVVVRFTQVDTRNIKI